MTWQESELRCRDFHAEGRLATFKSKREWIEFGSQAKVEGCDRGWIDGRRAKQNTQNDWSKTEFLDKTGAPIAMGSVRKSVTT